MLDTKEKVEKYMKYIDTENDGVIAYRLADEKEEIIVIFNALKEEIKVDVEDGCRYDIYVEGNKAGTDCIRECTGSINVEPISCTVLVRQ